MDGPRSVRPTHNAVPALQHDHGLQRRRRRRWRSMEGVGTTRRVKGRGAAGSDRRYSRIEEVKKCTSVETTREATC